MRENFNFSSAIVERSTHSFAYGGARASARFTVRHAGRWKFLAGLVFVH
jgi:hypothetical protein